MYEVHTKRYGCYGLGFQIGETPFERDPSIVLESKSNYPIGINATCGTGDNFVEDRTNYYGEVVDMEHMLCQRFVITLMSLLYHSNI